MPSRALRRLQDEVVPDQGLHLPVSDADVQGGALMAMFFEAPSAAGTGWRLRAMEEGGGWSFFVIRKDGQRDDVLVSGQDAQLLAHLILASNRYPPLPLTAETGSYHSNGTAHGGQRLPECPACQVAWPNEKGRLV